MAHAEINSTAKSGAPADQFVHSPLRHPDTQIRLLRSVQTSQCDAQEGFLKFALQAFDISEAPQYVAISYTWASTASPREIRVEDRPLLIGHSCHHALQQVTDRQRAEGLETYIWVDGICIDQDQLDEKAAQVSLMGDIYANAISVYACIGQHENDSEWVLSVFEDLVAACDADAAVQEALKEENPQSTIKSTIAAVTWPVLESIMQNNLLPSNEETISDTCVRFAFASRSLGQRDYWYRIWIVQELWLSSSVMILCGDSAMGLDCLGRAMEYLPWSEMLPFMRGRTHDTGKKDGRWPSTNLSHITKFLPQISTVYNLTAPRPKDRPICELLRIFSYWECTNFRDNIYGMLSISSWTNGRPRPDYRLNKTELLIQFIDHARDGPMAPWNLIPALRQLIGMVVVRTEDVWCHTQSLLNTSENCGGDKTQESNGVETCLGDAVRIQPHALTPCNACLVGTDDAGNLTAELFKMGRVPEKFQFDTSPEGSQNLFVRKQVAGYVHGDVKQGDFLIRPDRESYVWLAAKKLSKTANEEPKCNITGFAIVYPAYQMPHRDPDGESHYQLVVHLDVVDLIVSMVYDKAYCDGELTSNETMSLFGRKMSPQSCAVLEQRPYEEWHDAEWEDSVLRDNFWIGGANA